MRPQFGRGQYRFADLRMKEDALSKGTPLDVKPGRFRPDDKLLAFLRTSDHAASDIEKPERFAGLSARVAHNPGRGIMPQIVKTRRSASSVQNACRET